MKIVCFVLSTVKYPDRIKRIKETWANDIDTWFYSDHEDLTQNIIKVSDSSHYDDADKKQINIVNVIRQERKDILNTYDWVLFCDDDTFVNPKRAYEEFKHFNYNCSYGHTVSYQRYSDNPIYNAPGIPKDLEYPCGGGGFAISTYILKLCGNFIDYSPRFGDVNFGLNLYYKKIPFIDNIFFNTTPPEHAGHTTSDIVKSITYHRIVTDEDMKNLYDLTK